MTKNDVTANLPELFGAFAEIAKTHQNLIIDGEIISGEGKTEEEMRRVVSRINSRKPFGPRLMPVSFIPFDLIYNYGVYLNADTLNERRKQLNSVFSPSFRRRYGIRPSRAISTRIDSKSWEFVQRALDESYEGVILKKIDDPYYPGSTKWLKHKFLKEERSHSNASSST